MNFLISILFLSLILIQNVSAQIKCKETEIRVSGHFVDGYKTKLGKVVRGYFKDEYCRVSKIRAQNIKFDNVAPEGWRYKEDFKAWSENEISRFFQDGDKLPFLLRKQLIDKIVRGKKSIFPNNPAAALPLNRLLILYDDYFQRKDRARVLGHELAHFLYWQLSPEQKLNFAQISGWRFDELEGVRLPPKNLIYDDSAESPSEDFANNVEAFYFQKNKLRKNNFKMLKFLEMLEKEVK